MAGIDRDVMGGALQALEHMLDSVDQISSVAVQLVHAQRTGKPLAPSVLSYFQQQLEELSQQREQMRTVIAGWWKILENHH